MYLVKTRNWNEGKVQKSLLDITLKIGVKSDGEKYWLKTKSSIKAWVVWSYFMLVRPLSGGWTYIVRPNHTMDNFTYNCIY